MRVFVLLAAVSVLLPWATVYGADASLLLEPRTGVFPIGEEFPVRVLIDTAGGEVGSADVTIGYEPTDLVFVSYSTEGSIFGSIIKDEDETAYGRVRLQGIISKSRGPYKGGEGLFVTLTFRPLRNVATEVWFAQGSASPLLAAVGSIATNILAAPLQSATYTLVPKDVVPPLAAVSYASTSGFEIAASPQPTEGWFGTTSVKLSWTLPADVSEMRAEVGTSGTFIPSKGYSTPVSSLSFQTLSEGEQYFALQFKQGERWGEVVHYPLKVDRTPPASLTLTEVQSDSPDSSLSFEIAAQDAGSGISHYMISIDGSSTVSWSGEGGRYEPEQLEAGEHTLTVTALDRASNGTTTSHTFFVRSLEPPVLTSVPERLLSGDQVTVRGTTYPHAKVSVFVSFNDGEADEKKVESDSDGAFVATVAEAARAGKYTIWLSVKDTHGVVSPVSIKRSVNVSQPFIMLFGTIAVTYLSVIVPLIALILLLFLVLWLGYAWVRGYRSRVRRETRQAFGVVRDEFMMMRAELIKQIGMLEKANQSRELTHEEMRIFTDLSRRLDRIESHIEEEIDDIEPVPPEEHLAARPQAETRGETGKHTIRIEAR